MGHVQENLVLLSLRRDTDEDNNDYTDKKKKYNPTFIPFKATRACGQPIGLNG
jgi:hypothetical protein